MKAFAYTRVSTARQADEGLSLDVQADRVRLFCLFKGWELVESFEERGASATSLSRRPMLERAIQAVCQSKGVLVFYDLSRLARNTADAQDIFKRIEACGAQLASVTEPFDSTAAGKLLFDMMSAFAAFDSRQKGEKIAGSNAKTVKRLGYRTNGEQPYGYTITNGRREPVPAEQAIIARIRSLSRSLSNAAIADLLNAEGLRARRGGLWRPGTVWRIRKQK